MTSVCFSVELTAAKLAQPFPASTVASVREREMRTRRRLIWYSLHRSDSCSASTSGVRCRVTPGIPGEPTRGLTLHVVENRRMGRGLNRRERNPYADFLLLFEYHFDNCGDGAESGRVRSAAMRRAHVALRSALPGRPLLQREQEPTLRRSVLLASFTHARSGIGSA